MKRLCKYFYIFFVCFGVPKNFPNLQLDFNFPGETCNLHQSYSWDIRHQREFSFQPWGFMHDSSSYVSCCFVKLCMHLIISIHGEFERYPLYFSLLGWRDCDLVWYNSNIVFFSSIVDNSFTLTAQVWHVNGQEKILLQASDQSKFYSGDCFIFQYTYPGEDKEDCLIGTWIGKNSVEVK